MSEATPELFLHQLATLTHAGVPLEAGLRACAGQFSGKWQRASRAMASDLSAGDPIHLSASRHPECIDPGTVSLLEAGEKCGQLSAFLSHASELIAQRRRVREQLERRLAYPFFIYHAAVLIPSVRFFLLNGFFTWLLVVIAGLTPLYLATAAVWMLYRSRTSNSSRAEAIDSLLLQLPIIRPVIQAYATMNFCRCLRAFLLAGATFPKALPECAAVIGSQAAVLDLKRAVERLDQGELLTPSLSHCRFLDASSLSMISTAELSGTLPDILEKTAVMAAEQFSAKSSLLVYAVTGAAFLTALVMVLLQIFSIFYPLIHQMNELLK